MISCYVRNLFLILFFLDVLIVVYTQRVHLIEIKVKLKFTYFSLETNHYIVIESIHALFFVNNVVFLKLFWYKERVVSLCKIFRVNLVSIHLSAT